MVIDLRLAPGPRRVALSANQTGWLNGRGRRHRHLHLKQVFLDLKGYCDDPEGLRRELLGKDANGLGWVLNIQVDPDAYTVIGSLKTVRFVRHIHSQASIGVYTPTRPEESPGKDPT